MLISPVEMPIDEADLQLLAQAAPDAPAHMTPLIERHANITEQQLSRLLIDGVFGPRKVPQDKYAKDVAKRLWEDIDALPPRAIIDLPPDIEGDVP